MYMHMSQPCILLSVCIAYGEILSPIGRIWVPVMIFWTSSVCWSDGIGQGGGELAVVQMNFSAAFDRVNHGCLVFELQEAGVGGTILKVFQNFLSSLLAHCCFCCTLLIFLGYFRMCRLVTLATHPCFAEYHILVIGHLLQHHWMMSVSECLLQNRQFG